MADIPEKDCWIGFDLGGTKMLAVVYDAEFNPLGKKRKRSRGHEGQDAGLERIRSTIHQALAEANVAVDRVCGIGVGCPGPLDLEKGVIHDAPNLGWTNVPLRKILEDEFHAPAIIANDVDCGVFGEYRFGAAKSARCVVGVFPGTGIGGGAVYEGHIIRGKNTTCMEIGHINVIPNGPICGCGLRGCLEAVASRLAISAAAAQAAFRGQAPHLHSLVGTDLSKIRSGDIAASIDGGDEVVLRIVREAARHIGMAVAGVVHLLAPDMILLGGGLVEAMPKLFVDQVRDSARKNVMPSYQKVFDVVAAKLGNDATVMGAASWARECIEEESPVTVTADA
ncbi:MAG: ROK family protein [Planctomycetaceae bacterium]